MECTEREWETLVAAAAAANGWRVARVSIARSEAGWPDLILLHPAGRLVFAELKTNTGIVSHKQRRIHAELEAAGRPVHVWRPRQVDDVRAVLGASGTFPPPTPPPAPSPPAETNGDKPDPSVIMDAIVTAAADAYRITPATLLSRNRDGHAARARQIAMHVARETGMTYPVIGGLLDRNHTTVMHGCRKVAGDRDALEEARALADTLNTGADA